MQVKTALAASMLMLAGSALFLLGVVAAVVIAEGRDAPLEERFFELPLLPTASPTATATQVRPSPTATAPPPAASQLYFRCNDGTLLIGTSRVGACEGRGGIAQVSDVPFSAESPVPALIPPLLATPPAETGAPSTPTPTPTTFTSFAPALPNAPREAAQPSPTPTPEATPEPTATATPTPRAEPTPTPTPLPAPTVTVVPADQQPRLPPGAPASRSTLAGLWHAPVEDDVFLGRLEESGAGWVRIFLRWERIEPVETTPPSYDWAASDQALRFVRERGLQPLVTIVDPPSWAAFPTCGPFRTEAARDRWLRFVRAAVERYSRLPYAVRYWALYDEPDFRIQNPNDKFGGGAGGGCWGSHPADYGAMLRATYPVIKAADPAALVVLGPLAADGCEPTYNCEFLREVLDPAKGNAGASFDVAAFNYFPVYRRGWERFGASLLGKAEGIRRTMAEFGVSKPVLVAKTGILLDGSEAARAQANYVAQALTLGLADAGRPDGLGTQAVIWFSLRDSDDPNDRWGLVDASGNPKESFLVFQAWVKEMTGLRFARNESEPTYGSGPATPCDSGPYRCDALQKYVFAAGDREKWVLWVDAGPHRQPDRFTTTATRVVEVPASRVIALRNRTGDPLPYEVVQDQARIVVGESPLYLTLRR